VGGFAGYNIIAGYNKIPQSSLVNLGLGLRLAVLTEVIHKSWKYTDLILCCLFKKKRLLCEEYTYSYITGIVSIISFNINIENVPS
jgi:hypothetical protein